MRTVILGAGALGSILAAHLHRAGHEVAVVVAADIGELEWAKYTMFVPGAVRMVRAYGAQLARKALRHKVSGLQDLERGRPTAVEEIAGYAWRRSDELGLALPTLRTCYHLCSAISPPAGSNA